jgi:hypothetical protein
LNRRGIHVRKIYHHTETSMTKQKVAKTGFRFVLTIGVVNLFADLTYEGARAVSSILTIGSLRCSAASASCACVVFFSLTTSLFRAASHLFSDEIFFGKPFHSFCFHDKCSR